MTIWAKQSPSTRQPDLASEVAGWSEPPRTAPARHRLRAFLARGRRLLWFNRMLALVLLATAAWMVGA